MLLQCYSCQDYIDNALQVFVAGATGNTGKRVVQQLSGKGFKVLAGTRVSLLNHTSHQQGRTLSASFCIITSQAAPCQHDVRKLAAFKLACCHNRTIGIKAIQTLLAS